MVLQINRASIGHIWDACLDTTTFAGVGYLCGYGVNWLMSWTLKPSFFVKVQGLDLTSVTICCALFMVIDRVAKLIFYHGLGISDIKMSKPSYLMIRTGVNLTIAVGLFNQMASPFKLAPIEFKAVSAIILTAVAVYSQMSYQLLIFNRLNNPYATREI